MYVAVEACQDYGGTSLFPFCSGLSLLIVFGPVEN